MESNLNESIHIYIFMLNVFSLYISEATTHKQIEYVEINGIKYGFVPSTNKRYGFMRFLPGANKPYEESSAEIVS